MRAYPENARALITIIKKVLPVVYSLMFIVSVPNIDNSLGKILFWSAVFLFEIWMFFYKKTLKRL